MQTPEALENPPYCESNSLAWTLVLDSCDYSTSMLYRIKGHLNVAALARACVDFMQEKQSCDDSAEKSKPFSWSNNIPELAEYFNYQELACGQMFIEAIDKIALYQVESENRSPVKFYLLKNLCTNDEYYFKINAGQLIGSSYPALAIAVEVQYRYKELHEKVLNLFYAKTNLDRAPQDVLAT